MEAVALVVTTIVAPLTQMALSFATSRDRRWLFLVAALFRLASVKGSKLHWLNATMLVMALLLPYAGFMDMASRTAHHNTMAFGLALLSCLWLAVTRTAERRAPALRDPKIIGLPTAWDLSFPHVPLFCFSTESWPRCDALARRLGRCHLDAALVSRTTWITPGRS